MPAKTNSQKVFIGKVINGNRFKDISGHRYGRLVAIKRVGTKFKSPLWEALCDCGNKKLATTRELNSQEIRSCGCLQIESRIKHGCTIGGPSKLYSVWIAMKDRCFNSKNVNYHHYGGRGITVCKRWKNSVSIFIKDMGPRPLGMTVERRNNSGNYCPSNCYWATQAVQRKNTRSNRWLTFDGKTLIVKDWSEESGIPEGVLRNRLYRKWSVARTLTQPVQWKNERTIC